MATKKIIAVVGSTGNQGGAVVKALAGISDYEVRALTRNVDKPAAKALLKHGSNVTLQTCDITSKSALEKAFKGIYGAFVVTDYFAHKLTSKEDVKEEEEGRLMAEVAKAEGVKHIIFSTLPEVYHHSGGKYKNVHHFDGKYKIEQYIRGLGFETASFVAPSCYLQNFIGAGSCHNDKDGTVVFVSPLPNQDSKIPVCDIDDMGPVVKAIFSLGHKSNGKVYPIVSQFLPIKEVASDFEKVTGKSARVDLVPHEMYIKALSSQMGEFIATDLWEMMQFFADFGFGDYGKPEAFKNFESLGVHLKTWVDFLKETGFTGPE